MTASTLDRTVVASPGLVFKKGGARQTMFLPSGRMAAILGVSFVAGLASTAFDVGAGLWTVAGAMLTTFVVLHTFAASRRVPWIPGLIAAAACLQWIVAPWLVYALSGQMRLLAMPLDADTYFSYFVPAAIALTAGMYWPLRHHGRVAQVRRMVPADSRALARVCDVMLVGGFVSRMVLMPLAPGGLRYVAALVGGLTWVGAIGAMLLGRRGWRWRVIAALGGEAVRDAIETQFLELMVWGGLVGLMLVYRLRVRAIVVALSMVAASALLIAINGMKANYRLAIEAESADAGERPAMAVDALADIAASPGRLVSDDMLGRSIDRLNEGWIAGRVLIWVPTREPFARGETVVTALRSVFVPRVIDADKVTAGGAETVPRFTGLELLGATSMNLSIPGEMYANFGYTGGLIGTLAVALLIGLAFREFVRLSRHTIVWYAWSAYVLSAAISAEMGVLEVLNGIAKPALVAAAVVYAVPAWRRLLPGARKARAR